MAWAGDHKIIISGEGGDAYTDGPSITKTSKSSHHHHRGSSVFDDEQAREHSNSQGSVASDDAATRAQWADLEGKSAPVFWDRAFLAMQYARQKLSGRTEQDRRVLANWDLSKREAYAPRGLDWVTSLLPRSVAHKLRDQKDQVLVDYQYMGAWFDYYNEAWNGISDSVNVPWPVDTIPTFTQQSIYNANWLTGNSGQNRTSQTASLVNRWDFRYHLNLMAQRYLDLQNSLKKAELEPAERAHIEGEIQRIAADYRPLIEPLVPVNTHFGYLLEAGGKVTAAYKEKVSFAEVAEKYTGQWDERRYYYFYSQFNEERWNDEYNLYDLANQEQQSLDRLQQIVRQLHRYGATIPGYQPQDAKQMEVFVIGNVAVDTIDIKANNPKAAALNHLKSEFAAIQQGLTAVRARLADAGLTTPEQRELVMAQWTPVKWHLYYAFKEQQNRFKIEHPAEHPDHKNDWEMLVARRDPLQEYVRNYHALLDLNLRLENILQTALEAKTAIDPAANVADVTEDKLLAQGRLYRAVQLKLLTQQIALADRHQEDYKAEKAVLVEQIQREQGIALLDEANFIIQANITVEAKIADPTNIKQLKAYLKLHQAEFAMQRLLLEKQALGHRQTALKLDLELAGPASDQGRAQDLAQVRAELTAWDKNRDYYLHYYYFGLGEFSHRFVRDKAYHREVMANGETLPYYPIIDRGEAEAEFKPDPLVFEDHHRDLLELELAMPKTLVDAKAVYGADVTEDQLRADGTVYRRVQLHLLGRQIAEILAIPEGNRNVFQRRKLKSLEQKFKQLSDQAARIAGYQYDEVQSTVTTVEFNSAAHLQAFINAGGLPDNLGNAATDIADIKRYLKDNRKKHKYQQRALQKRELEIYMALRRQKFRTRHDHLYELKNLRERQDALHAIGQDLTDAEKQRLAQLEAMMRSAEYVPGKSTDFYNAARAQFLALQERHKFENRFWRRMLLKSLYFWMAVGALVTTGGAILLLLATNPELALILTISAVVVALNSGAANYAYSYLFTSKYVQLGTEWRRYRRLTKNWTWYEKLASMLEITFFTVFLPALAVGGLYGLLTLFGWNALAVLVSVAAISNPVGAVLAALFVTATVIVCAVVMVVDSIKKRNDRIEKSMFAKANVNEWTHHLALVEEYNITLVTNPNTWYKRAAITVIAGFTSTWRSLKKHGAMDILTIVLFATVIIGIGFMAYAAQQTMAALVPGDLGIWLGVVVAGLSVIGIVPFAWASTEATVEKLGTPFAEYIHFWRKLFQAAMQQHVVLGIVAGIFIVPLSLIGFALYFPATLLTTIFSGQHAATKVLNRWIADTWNRWFSWEISNRPVTTAILKVLEFIIMPAFLSAYTGIGILSFAMTGEWKPQEFVVNVFKATVATLTLGTFFKQSHFWQDLSNYFASNDPDRTWGVNAIAFVAKLGLAAIFTCVYLPLKLIYNGLGLLANSLRTTVHEQEVVNAVGNGLPGFVQAIQTGQPFALAFLALVGGSTLSGTGMARNEQQKGYQTNEPMRLDFKVNGFYGTGFVLLSAISQFFAKQWSKLVAWYYNDSIEQASARKYTYAEAPATTPEFTTASAVYRGLSQAQAMSLVAAPVVAAAPQDVAMAQQARAQQNDVRRMRSIAAVAGVSMQASILSGKGPAEDTTGVDHRTECPPVAFERMPYAGAHGPVISGADAKLETALTSPEVLAAVRVR